MIARRARAPHAPAHAAPTRQDILTALEERLAALVADMPDDQAEGTTRILEHVVAATMAARERGNLIVSADLTIRMWRDGADLLAVGPNGEAIGSLTVRWRA